jgi:ubiquinol-cytochrome c reductase cytochrome c1 subunit
MKALFAAGIIGLSFGVSTDKSVNSFIYRDDIGAFWGIKGYEEQVTEVGTHRGIK